MMLTDTDTEVNALRRVSFVFSALSCLQRDPFCRECSSFVRCIEAIKDEFISLEKAINKNGALPEEMRCILSNTYSVLADLNIPDRPVSQKKEGNCMFPKRVCMAKAAFAMHEQLQKDFSVSFIKRTL